MGNKASTAATAANTAANTAAKAARAYPKTVLPSAPSPAAGTAGAAATATTGPAAEAASATAAASVQATTAQGGDTATQGAAQTSASAAQPPAASKPKHEAPESFLQTVSRLHLTSKDVSIDDPKVRKVGEAEQSVLQRAKLSASSPTHSLQQPNDDEPVPGRLNYRQIALLFEDKRTGTLDVAHVARQTGISEADIQALARYFDAPAPVKKDAL